MPVNGLLVQGEDEIYRVSDCPNRPSRRPNNRIVMPSLDPRWIVKIHIYRVTKVPKEMSDDLAGTADPVTCPSPDEYRDILFCHEPAPG
jgi:hypothetical protein